MDSKTARLERLRQRMADLELDALVIRHVSDLRWLTGFVGVFDGEPAHTAFVSASTAAIHTDSRYSNALRHRAIDTPWTIDDELVSHSSFLASRIPPHFPSRIGIEHDMPLSFFRALEKAVFDKGIACELVETVDIMALLRAVKDEEEIACLRRAQEATDSAFDHMCEWMTTGMTEADICLELEYTLRRLGSGDISFPSIVAAGPHGASPHAVPSQSIVRKGDMVVMDFGAVYADYRADMTRTVCFGSPDSKQREVYDIVRDAHERAAAAIAVGKKGADIHALASDIIDATDYRGLFGHGLGHGVGLDVHEQPNLSPKSEYVLEAGNVVTVEPGIYIPEGFGVRLEDFGVVGAQGFEAFTTSSHDLVEL